MEIFKGRITYHGYEGLNDSTRYCGSNKALIGSEFLTKRYCKNNFNNIANTFVLLFELMVVNQWSGILLQYDFSLKLTLILDSLTFTLFVYLNIDQFWLMDLC